jgi:glycosyltransferase involved in cell wall biosynthesis
MGYVMSAPLISVIMPVFNAERFVGQAVESILQQTFDDFEFIAIDDGSTDHSLEILKKYASSDRRIKIILREHRGLVDSLNHGVDSARGDWLARMDADDIALPQRFERQLQWLEQTGADICGSWIKLFGTADRRVIKQPQTDEAIKMKMIFCAPFTHPVVIMKTDMVKQLRYNNAWEACEDYDLWERAARAGWKMTNVPDILLLYRQHKAQISTMALSTQHALSQKIRRRYLEYIFDFMKLEKEWIDEVVKLREPIPSTPNMNHVDSAFIELLKNNHGEARDIIFDHATQLYFRAAANCPDVVTRWSRLNKSYGVGMRADIIIPLWLLSVLRVQSNSRLFERLKGMYLCLIHST